MMNPVLFLARLLFGPCVVLSMREADGTHIAYVEIPVNESGSITMVLAQSSPYALRQHAQEDLVRGLHERADYVLGNLASARESAEGVRW